MTRFVVGLVVGLALALAWASYRAGDVSNEVVELRAAAAASQDSMTQLAAIADASLLALDSAERVYEDSVAVLAEVRRTLVLEVSKRRETTDRLLDAVPDSLGLEDAIWNERAAHDADMATMQAILEQQDDLIADLREAIDTETTARLAAQSNAARWRALAEAEAARADAAERSNTLWKIATGVAALLGIVLGAAAG